MLEDDSIDLDINDDIFLDDEEIEKIEENTPLDDFDLETLIVEGTDAAIERKIDYFNPKTQKQGKMAVRLKPVSNIEWTKVEGAVSKNKNKNKIIDFRSRIVAKSLLDKNNELVPISLIYKMGKGTIGNIYEEVKIISGQFEDKTEDKIIEKMVDF